jgi:hypothetical protein
MSGVGAGQLSLCIQQEQACNGQSRREAVQAMNQGQARMVNLEKRQKGFRSSISSAQKK